MQNILDQIVTRKRIEVEALYQKYDLDDLKATVKVSKRDFYEEIAAAKATKVPFIISEFKRKSPSEGWINRDIALEDQILAYTAAGTCAISVLTDTDFFGGNYEDLNTAAETLSQCAGKVPLLLQKDFIIDPIQVYLARLHGANFILLIAAILTPEALESLRGVAASLGMGALVEVHDQSELDQVNHLDFPVLGINNRDLKTFRTSLNRVNVLKKSPSRFQRIIVSESGVGDFRDFQAVRRADAFLIGTGLMRNLFGRDFRTHLHFEPTKLFKACGIRSSAVLTHFAEHPESAPHYMGINFSPLSKRRMPDSEWEAALPYLLDANYPSRLVAVFYKNTAAEIKEILAKYPFKTVQLYSGDVDSDFVRSLSQRVIMAVSVRTKADLESVETFAPDVDFFILDGAQPGSGQGISTVIPVDFPYPFLLAGGMHLGNLHLADSYLNCIGVDMASGIESYGNIDIAKIEAISGISVKI